MATLTTIPVQDGVEYIRVLLTMGAGTPTGDAINLRGSQAYVTLTGDAAFGNSVNLTLDGIDPHGRVTTGQGDLRLRHTGNPNASFSIWKSSQVRTPKLVYASSADGNTVRQGTEGAVGGGYWNWHIQGQSSFIQVAVGDTINLVIYVPAVPAVMIARAAVFTLGAPSFAAVLRKIVVPPSAGFTMGAPSFSAVLDKIIFDANARAAAFTMGAPVFAAVLGKLAYVPPPPPGSGIITSYIGGTIHPIETASLQITRRVGERPISECDIFFRDLNAFRRPRRGEQLEIHESGLPLALLPSDEFNVLSFGGEYVLSFGGEYVLSFSGSHHALDPAIRSTLLFGGTVLDSKIALTHTGRIGRCVVTGTGYAALLDITIKERYATTHGATCAAVILDLLTRYASGLGLTYDAASIVATNICPDLIFGYEFLSQALTLVADAGNVVWGVDERGVFIARSRDHLVRFDQTTRGAGFTVREGVTGTVDRIEHREDPTNFANEVTVLGSAPEISTTREEFTGDGATKSWPLAYQSDAVTDVDVVDAAGSIQPVDSFGGDGDAWQVDTTQSRIEQRAGDTVLATGWKVRVTYNFHLPVIYTARDDASIATYGLVAAPVEEDPELDTIESVSQRATSKLRRHTVPTQVLDLLLRPGTAGPFEGAGVEVILLRHGINGEIWLVEEVEIEELESQLLQWRITLLQRDHESLYAQSVKPRRIQPSEPANLGAIPGIRTVLTDVTRIGSESDLFSAFLGGSHAERLTATAWTDIPGSAVAQLHGAVFGTSAIQWIATAKLVQPTDGLAVTAEVRLYNRTTAQARGRAVAVTSPHADFHGSTRLALDDSLNRYVLQGRIVERDIHADSNFAAGLYVWAGEFVKPR